MNHEALIGAQVELTAPDGRIFRFRVSALTPYAGETYAVLEHAAGDGQLLVTHIETDADGAPVFVVVGEDDIISAVLEKQVAMAIAHAMENTPEMDQDDDEEEEHEHHHHHCGCGCHHHHG